MQQRVLIVEDEREIARLVELHLRDLGCAVTLAHEGHRGLRLAEAGGFDLIILDLSLPGVDGLEICRRVRAHPAYTPILMLTARSSEIDRVVGLESGADDYLTKPFSVRELVARVKAIFRRVEALQREPASRDEAPIRSGALAIDPLTRKVQLAGRPVRLTAKEFDLLVQFARNPERVYTRSDLLDLVWGYGHNGYEHTVNSHINRLRSKIEADPSAPRFIQTVWGVGYRFTDAEASAELGGET